MHVKTSFQDLSVYRQDRSFEIRQLVLSLAIKHVKYTICDLKIVVNTGSQ